MRRQQHAREYQASVRAAESSEQTMHKQQHDREYQASVRAAESNKQTLHRQQHDREYKASVRAAESSEQTLQRQQHDREYKASVRAAESSEQTLHRQQHDREYKASVRAAESSEQTLQRQQHDREYKASVKATESSEQTLHRQQHDREYKASVRAAKKANVSIEQAIVSFHSDIKNGPDFVCTCCHRLMYGKSVVLCNPAKYSKCGDDLLNCVFSADLRYVCDTGNEYVCTTCDRALKRGVMPLQAKANGLQLPAIPPELADLNALELRLICLRLPFMKMVALPSGLAIKERRLAKPNMGMCAFNSVMTELCSFTRARTESEIGISTNGGIWLL